MRRFRKASPWQGAGLWRKSMRHTMSACRRASLEADMLGRAAPSGPAAEYRSPPEAQVAPQMSFDGDPRSGPSPTAERPWLG